MHRLSRAAWVALVALLPAVALGHEPPPAAPVAPATPPAAPAPPPLDASTRDFDQIHLDLEVTPDLAARTVDGKATLDVEAMVPNLTTLRLHCVDTEVKAVTCPKGTPLAHEVKDGVLSIRLAEA